MTNLYLTNNMSDQVLTRSPPIFFFFSFFADQGYFLSDMSDICKYFQIAQPQMMTRSFEI